MEKNSKDIAEQQQWPVQSQNDEHSKKKIRCKNWPNCKNDKCEYLHPSETCQYFPKCQFGSQCLYIHPNIPCKYGFYCTRINCSYSHSSGYDMSCSQYIPQVPTYTQQKFKNLKIDNTKKGTPEEGGNQINESNSLQQQKPSNQPGPMDINPIIPNNLSKPRFFPNYKLVKSKKNQDSINQTLTQNTDNKISELKPENN